MVIVLMMFGRKCFLFSFCNWLECCCLCCWCVVCD